MKHLDLFSGIGGFALAARWMGWETVGFVEIDKFCQKVLTKNFSNIPIHGDIKTFKGEKLRGAVDIATGGFPCQPYSLAGKRKGTEDDRHLWPEMLRVIGEIQPRFVVGENVYGLINWSGGLVFEQVQTDLESKGYEVTSVILPACSKDARHRRERIWFIAHYNGNGFSNGSERKEKGRKGQSLNPINSQIATHANGKRIQGQLQEEVYRIGRDQGRQTFEQLTDSFRRSDTFEPKLCRTLHGIPNGVDRIKSLGNAVVPQVVYEIFKAIEKTFT